MSYIRAKQKYEEGPQEDDDYRRLLCSFPGCQKAWTVKIEAPMCSQHQWGEKKVKRDVASLLQPKYEQWYDNESL